MAGGRHATVLRIRDANAPTAATDSDERRQVRVLQRRAVDRTASLARSQRPRRAGAATRASDRFLASVFERR
jgi:hypothetical protein